MGVFLSKLSSLREWLFQPSTSGESLPQPSTSGESLPQPSTSGESLPQPSTSGESLPQPSTSGESLPQPSTSGESLPQPSTSGGSYLQYIRNSKRRRYLIQLDAYLIQLSTRMPETAAATAQEYLNLATSELREAESKSVQFNHKQCEYLVNNLKLSLNNVQGVVHSHSLQQVLECLGSLKLLVRLAIDINSFIDECSKEEWIQAATLFMDASTHVASLSHYLKACTVLLCKQSNGTLQQTLANISKELDSCEIENARQDQDSLLKRLQAALEEGSISSTPEDKELAHKLIGRLQTALDGPSACPQYLQNWRVDLDHVKLKRGEFLGSGAAATVYNSKCMGAEVAEKSFEGKGYDRKFVGIVEGEVKHMVRLSHPNIIQILHYAVDEHSCSMVVEKMDGDLDTLIKNRLHGELPGTIPFPIDEALDIMLQTAEGMHYIHEENVVHRDLKPCNILFKYVEKDPTIGGQLIVKVADFGESKRKESTITYSTQTYNIGTTRYMAPEVICLRQEMGANRIQNSTSGRQANKKYPFKSDIYSYAMVCYMILTGEEPFPTVHGDEFKRKIVLAKDRPELLPNQCPDMLKALIERCWHPDPVARPWFGQICEELRLIKISLGRDWASNPYQLMVQVNHMQCEYLIERLKVAIQIAQIYFGLKERSESLGILEFLIRLAEDVQIFIHNCCNDKWIIASIMLPNTFEHVASIAYKLELCTQLCGSSPTSEIIESLEERVQHDQIALMERLTHSDISSAIDFELAGMLRRRLEAASPVLAPNTESSNWDAWRVDSTEWTIVLKVGEGGFAAVYRGEWLGARVAVKSFEGPVESYANGALRMHASMSHPNIAQFYCWSVTNQQLSIVMELMDEDLLSLMRRKLRDYKTPFTLLQSIDIALQISEAVKYMHQHHIVHRDLKSPNILVKSMKIPTVDIEAVYAKVCDFELSKRNYNNSTFSEQTYNVGTVRWMAPESIRMGQRDEEGLSREKLKLNYPFRKDVYSFGILCFEILTGELPFGGMEGRELRERVLGGYRPQLPNECPPMLRALIESCWGPDPKSRPTFVKISEELYRLKCLYLQEPTEPMDRTMATKEELKDLQEELEELKDELGLSNLYIPYSSLSASRVHLGRGGSYTTVYKVKLDKADVAQKEFPLMKSEKFKKELQILGRLGSHPNVIGLIHYSMNIRLSSIVMELMEEDLRVFIRERFPFSMAEAIDIILQIAKGMRHIHEHGIVHRDLKAENILIKKDAIGKWLVKVADFGESTELHLWDEEVSMVGTIRWMAPEVMSLEEYDGVPKRVDTPSKIDLFKTDVYSFGMVCYEIMAGKIPFFDISKRPLYEELREVIIQVEQNGLQPILPEEFHPDLKYLIRSCWDKEANRRPTFGQIVEDLSGIQSLFL